MVVSRIVLGLDGERKGLDGAQVQGGHFLDMTLFVLELPR